MNTPDRYAKSLRIDEMLVMVLSSNASLPGSYEVFGTVAALSSVIVYASDDAGLTKLHIFFSKKKSFSSPPVDGPGSGTQ